MIGLKIDVRGAAELQRKLAGVSREIRDKAMQPAINKVADKARTEINRAITQEYAVKATEVRQAVTLRRAGGGNLTAIIEIFGSASKRGRSANLIRFLGALNGLAARGAKAKKADIAALEKQLGFIIRRAGGLKKIEGAFIGNKGRTVFRRTGKARLPIEPLQVIGFSQMFKSRKIERRVMERIEAELPIEIQRAIKKILG
jgi:hypothetical protein